MERGEYVGASIINSHRPIACLLHHDQGPASHEASGSLSAGTALESLLLFSAVRNIVAINAFSEQIMNLSEVKLDKIKI